MLPLAANGAQRAKNQNVVQKIEIQSADLKQSMVIGKKAEVWALYRIFLSTCLLLCSKILQCCYFYLKEEPFRFPN